MGARNYEREGIQVLGDPSASCPPCPYGLPSGAGEAPGNGQADVPLLNLIVVGVVIAVTAEIFLLTLNMKSRVK